MNILVVGHVLPYPPRTGGLVRRWEMLRHLAQRHHVTLICFGTPELVRAPQPLQDIGIDVILVAQPPAIPSPDTSPSGTNIGFLKPFGVGVMSRAIEHVQPHTFDVVLVDTIYMAMYRDLLPPHAVLLEQNVESQLYKQQAQLQRGATSGSSKSNYDVIWRIMQQFEGRAWSQFPLRVAVSEHDRQLIDQRSSSGKTIVVENGVNLENFTLLPEQHNRRILFMGALDYLPNQDAACYLVEHIMPHVWTQAPDIELRIAGRHPPAHIVALADTPRIQIIDTPVDMRPVAAQASIVVVPLRLGGGTRLKILEAQAWGLPVISTSLGAEGLAVTDGKDILLRDNPAEFASTIVQLLSDSMQRTTLRANGRALVIKRYNWNTIFDAFENELEGFVNALSPDYPHALHSTC